MNDTQVEAGLYIRLNQIEDQESFLKFVRELIKDRENPSDWENDTIKGFLEAALAWAEATNMGESQGLGEEQIWKKFAVFLYCGKIYE